MVSGNSGAFLLWRDFELVELFPGPLPWRWETTVWSFSAVIYLLEFREISTFVTLSAFRDQQENTKDGENEDRSE